MNLSRKERRAEFDRIKVDVFSQVHGYTKMNNPFRISNSVTPKDLDRLFGKNTVEFVCKNNNNLYKLLGNSCRAWKGETKDKYFSIAFIGGMLMVSLEEREMFIHMNLVNIGGLVEIKKISDDLVASGSITITDKAYENGIEVLKNIVMTLFF